MKKLQIYIRRDKFARERPGPRELRRPPSPPSSYWRPPPSRPPPRAYPYPPPSLPREVSSKTATYHKSFCCYKPFLGLSTTSHFLFLIDNHTKSVVVIVLWKEPRGGAPAHHGRSGSPSSSGGPPSKRPRTHEGTRTIQVQFLNDWSHFCKEND